MYKGVGEALDVRRMWLCSNRVELVGTGREEVSLEQWQKWTTALEDSRARLSKMGSCEVLKARLIVEQVCRE